LPKGWRHNSWQDLERVLRDSPHHGSHYDQLADVLRPWHGTTNPPTVALGRIPKSAPKYAPAAGKVLVIV